MTSPTTHRRGQQGTSGSRADDPVVVAGRPRRGRAGTPGRRSRQRRVRRALISTVAALATFFAAWLIAGHEVGLTKRGFYHPVSSSQIAAIQQATGGHVVARSKGSAPAAAPPTSAADHTPAGHTAAVPPGVRPFTLRTTTTGATWVEEQHTMTYGGLQRGYLVYRPKTDPGNKPLRILLELSGAFVTAQHEAERADFQGIMPPSIVVYPEMVGKNWNAGACCGTAHAQGIDDIGFVTAVVHQVQADEPHASHGHILVVGYSNGAKLAMQVACVDASMVQAVAVYAGTRTSNCADPPPPVSVLLGIGSADPLTSLGPANPITEEGYTEPTVTGLLQQYNTADGCAPADDVVTAGTVTVTLWSHCRSGFRNAIAVFGGATHVWPERSGATPSAEQVMWDFFRSLPS